MKPSNLKDGNPGIADVVKVDGVLERIDLPGFTLGVVLVPVDTRVVVCAVVRVYVQGALQSSLIQPGHRVAFPHAVVSAQGADERALVVILSLVVLGQILELLRQRARRKKDSEDCRNYT